MTTKVVMGAASPTRRKGPFANLLQDIRQCKAANTCPNLWVRAFYFEPNPETAHEWQVEGRFKGQIDRRVAFVCESPGGRVGQFVDVNPRRNWCHTEFDQRFTEMLRRFGFGRCYLTNLIKCGVRTGLRHSTEEIEACSRHLVRELGLVKPLVMACAGKNAFAAVRYQVLPQLTSPPIAFSMNHYSDQDAKRLAERWAVEFPELRRLVAKLSRRG